MRSILLLVVFCVLSGVASADAEPWMKRPNPYEIGLYTVADKACPFSDEDLRAVVDGELVRSRIKSNEIYTEFGLWVRASCTDVEMTDDRIFGKVMSLEMRFMSDLMMLWNVPNYGTILLANPRDAHSYFLDAVRSQTAEAVTDYLKANL